jgi:hypothetical protein
VPSTYLLATANLAWRTFAQVSARVGAPGAIRTPAHGSGGRFKSTYMLPGITPGPRLATPTYMLGSRVRTTPTHTASDS